MISMSDAPTQRFEPLPPANSGGNQPKSRLPLVLIIVGAILVIAVILLLVVLLRGNAGTPQAADTTTPAANQTQTTAPTTSAAPAVTPTPTPSTSHTNAPPPVQSTNPAFTVFQVQKTVNSCSGGPYYTGAPPIVKVTWATIRTNSAWIIEGTDDAANAKFRQIPLSGNQSDFQYEIDFPCGSPSATYTITVVGSNGKHLSKTWTIKNTSPGP